MKIDILCVGKLKEQYLRDASKEYEKRLSRYVKLNITEVSDEKIKDEDSSAESARVKRIEGERLLKHIDKNAYVIILEIEGKMLSSTELASHIEELSGSGISHIQIVIGGSLGLDREVIKTGKLSLSFSRFTFPHQLMRIILLEQIYRSFRIISKEPYHK